MPADRKTRAALFVDFDNAYLALRSVDASSASSLAFKSSRWLSWFESSLKAPEGSPGRRILMRRCYMNPNGFAQFRAEFIRSGFEVIDCPPLTGGGKTSTDIRMVMEIMDALGHETRFDEFIILSGDADFTPVLVRLREHDRRTLVVPIGPASAAYKAAADRVIGHQEFIESGLRKASPPPKPEPPGPEHEELPQEEGGEKPGDLPEARRDVAEFVQSLVKGSARPVPMSQLAPLLCQEFGDGLRANKWLGSGSFRRFLRRLPLSEVEVSSGQIGYVFDPLQHEVPEEPERPQKPGPTEDPKKPEQPKKAEPTDRFDGLDANLTELAKRLRADTNTPYLTPFEYWVLFEEIAKEVNANGYDLSQTSKNVRDSCGARNVPIARKNIYWALKGVTFSGHELGSGATPEEPYRIAEAYVRNVFDLSQRAEMNLTSEDRQLVRTWILGYGSS